MLGVTQLFTAAWIFRKLPWDRPRGVAALHRWSGRIAFLLTIPVAYHCVFKLGFHDESARSTEVGLTEAMYQADPLRPTFTPNDELHVRRMEVSMLHEQRLTEDVTLRTLAYAYTTSFLWRRQDYDRAPVPGVSYDRIVGDASTPGGANQLARSQP